MGLICVGDKLKIKKFSTRPLQKKISAIGDRRQERTHWTHFPLNPLIRALINKYISYLLSLNKKNSLAHEDTYRSIDIV